MLWSKKLKLSNIFNLTKTETLYQLQKNRSTKSY